MFFVISLKTQTQMRNYFLLALLFLGGLFSAQQAEEFRTIKNYFDHQESLLRSSFAQKYSTLTTDSSKEEIRKDYNDFMSKLDSIRNIAYLDALIKVKNREDLSMVKRHQAKILCSTKTVQSQPEFPNGINSLRDKVAGLFYSECLQAEKKEVSTVLNFIVEEDGSISEVRALGEDVNLNKQAEIALYLLPEKFSKPAIIDGNAVAYSFQMPLIVKFN